MITLTQGNLLASKAEALVNAVNVVGVMGKGIALQFKQTYPAMFKAYAKACKAGQVRLGQMHVYELSGSDLATDSNTRWIINFPTKGHFRDSSRIEDIKTGLLDLVETIRRLNIHSIAIPALGCGYGGLGWDEVRPIIEAALKPVAVDAEILLFHSQSI